MNSGLPVQMPKTVTKSPSSAGNKPAQKKTSVSILSQDAD